MENLRLDEAHHLTHVFIPHAIAFLNNRLMGPVGHLDLLLDNDDLPPHIRAEIELVLDELLEVSTAVTRMWRSGQVASNDLTFGADTDLDEPLAATG